MYQLQEEMSYVELKNWLEYYRRRPLGWREDLRTSYIVQSMGSKVKGNELFQSLATIYKEEEENDAARVAKLQKNAFIQQFVMPMLEEQQCQESE